MILVYSSLRVWQYILEQRTEGVLSVAIGSLTMDKWTHDVFRSVPPDLCLIFFIWSLNPILICEVVRCKKYSKKIDFARKAARARNYTSLSCHVLTCILTFLLCVYVYRTIGWNIYQHMHIIYNT